MNKDELIELHQMFYEIKEYFETIQPNLTFPQYVSLNIRPEHKSKSKLEHKYAVFILGSEIAEAMRNVETISARGIPVRMRKLAEKTLKEMNAEHIQ